MCLRHLSAPAKMALFTRALAIWALYAFLPKGRAPCKARPAASSATSSLSTLPLRKSSASLALSGTGATAPSTSRASRTFLARTLRGKKQ